MSIDGDREFGDDRRYILRQTRLVLQTWGDPLKELKDFRTLFHEGLDEPARAGQPQGALQDLLGPRRIHPAWQATPPAAPAHAQA